MTLTNPTNESDFGVRVDPDRRTVIVRGELDLATAGLMLDASSGLLRREAGPLTIDLSALSFIDSSGLEVLARLAEQQRESAGEFTIRNASARTKRVFVAAGLASLL